MDDNQLLLKLSRRTRFTQFLVWIALFFTAVGIAAGYKNWLRMHDKAKANVVAVANIEKTLPTLANKERIEALVANVDSLSTRNKDYVHSALKELRNVQDSTQHIADTVYTQVEALTMRQEATNKNWTQGEQDWSLSEIHYLLQTASLALQLKQDKAGSILAFNLADELLVKKGALNLLPLRKQISHDIALVLQYELPDISGLSSQIDVLLEQLKPEIKEPSPPPSEEQKLINISELEEKEASLVTRIKKSINDAVVIKRFDKPMQDEMDELAKENLYQLLSLRLETLRLLLLQGKNITYHKQLERIQTLIKTYYPKSKIDEFDDALNILSAANLEPEKPIISGSLRLLDKLIPLLGEGKEK